MIRILRSGPLNTIQDLGRAEGRRWGVSRAGAMDTVALRTANALLGQAAGEAAIEVAIFPFELRFAVDCAFAVTGAGAATLDGRPLPASWALRASARQTLTLDQGPRGVFGYVAFAGGLDVPERLGSRATDLKGGFGGADGKGLSSGQTLHLRPGVQEAGVPAEGYGLSFGALPARRTGTQGETRVRAIAAAEWDAFTDEARRIFENSLWTVSRDVNRTGYRLSGPSLRTRSPLELLSHGLVPGVVQVPPSGQPIVQMADANTAGGYPKIATVISADLWALAQTRSGEPVGFDLVSWEEAIAAMRELDRRVLALDMALRAARERNAAGASLRMSQAQP
ncbi:MAG TPA: biotin-dependent carboxyltransferase family protein [Caulobacteraceae bacterium]|nr:biotin-dependent carboxyltransferase family protein [Caulobacteraceae bacterium]